MDFDQKYVVTEIVQSGKMGYTKFEIDLKKIQ